MAFQSRVVLRYVQVNKKLDGWQEKKKVIHEATELLHVRPHEPVADEPSRGRSTEAIKPDFKQVSQTQVVQNRNSHRILVLSCAENLLHCP